MSDLGPDMSGVGRVGGGSAGKGGVGSVLGNGGGGVPNYNPAQQYMPGAQQTMQQAQQPQLSFSDIMKMFDQHRGGVKDTSMANNFGAGNKMVGGTGKGGASG